MSEIKVNSIKGVGASTAAITVNNTDGTCTANITNNLSNRNLIINGSMIIDQRNSGASVAVGNNYVIDRFKFQKDNDGAGNCQQVSDAPAGFKKSLKFTVTTQDSSLSAAQYMYVRHIIEGNNFNVADFGTANAKSVTLSFHVKSSLTGTFSGAIWNNAFNRSNVFTYTISSANTWEKKTITFTGDTSGTWETGTARGLNIGWSLGLGSNYLTGTTGSWQGAGFIGSTSSVNVINTNNATWQLTGVQLEVGSVATDFEHRSYGQELALCQRYFYMHASGAEASASNRAPIATGAMYNSGDWNGVVNFPVKMRTSPSLYKVQGTDYFIIFGDGGNNTCNNAGLDTTSPQSGTVNLSGGLAQTSGTSHWGVINNDLARLGFQAEL